MEDKKIILNSALSQRAVNVDLFSKINIESKTNTIPLGDINKTLNLGEQFNKERQNSKLYRISGNITSLFTNVLFNNTGDNSWSTFNKNKFRIVPNGNVNNSDDDLSYKQSIEKYLTENNGWFGYFDPNPDLKTKCTWVDMEPNRNLFSMTPKNVKNWEITITYPTYFNNLPGNYEHPAVKGGLLLIDVDVTNIGNRQMLTFTTSVKHGLKEGETVKLKGLLESNNSVNQSVYNGEYTVIRLGKNGGEDKLYNFTVDINTLININNNSRMVRVLNDKESSYYVRVFKKIKTKNQEIVTDDDYEIYPLAFSQNIYEDKNHQFIFNEDIDISGLLDNRGKPLTEIYISIIKTDSGGVFTRIKSGINGKYTNKNLPELSNINKITNNEVNSEVALEDNLDINQEMFYGDVVEYNIYECKENVLSEVYHRFNTINRENGGSVDGIALGRRFEGYVYKPHHRIKIKDLSPYIEQGFSDTLNKPQYSDSIGDGRYLWRDILDIGISNSQENSLDYPFLNGCHYINKNIVLPLKRQDPFGDNNLLWINFPNDSISSKNMKGLDFKTPQNDC